MWVSKAVCVPSRAQLKDTGASHCGLLEISPQKGGVGVGFSGISLCKMFMCQGNVAMLKRGRRGHCSAGIGHQRGAPQRKAGPGGCLCLWGGWGMGWMPAL